MDFSEVVTTRKSIRKYTSQPVEREDILQALELAIRAANAGNQQSWRFYIVESPEAIRRMGEVVEEKLNQLGEQAQLQHKLPGIKKWTMFFQEAPCVIAVAASRYVSPLLEMAERAGYSAQEVHELFSRPDLQTIGACIQLALLALHQKGYGACWMTNPLIAKSELEKILGIQEPWFLAALIPVGKPAEDPSVRPRKTVEEVVHFV